MRSRQGRRLPLHRRCSHARPHHRLEPVHGARAGRRGRCVVDSQPRAEYGDAVMWTYQQSTGNLTDWFGSVLGQGYSGNGSDLDNPAAEGVIGHGPIPQGFWTIGPFETYPHLGEIVAPLMPCEGNTMDGREGGFFIHGDNQAMDH